MGECQGGKTEKKNQWGKIITKTHDEMREVTKVRRKITLEIGGGFGGGKGKGTGDWEGNGKGRDWGSWLHDLLGLGDAGDCMGKAGGGRMSSHTSQSSYSGHSVGFF